MKDMPKEIWAWADPLHPDEESGEWLAEETGDTETRYTRTDIYEEALAEIERLRADLGLRSAEAAAGMAAVALWVEDADTFHPASKRRTYAAFSEKGKDAKAKWLTLARVAADIYASRWGPLPKATPKEISDE